MSSAPGSEDDLDIGSLTLVVLLLAALPVVVLRAMGIAPFLLSAAVSPAALVLRARR